MRFSFADACDITGTRMKTAVLRGPTSSRFQTTPENAADDRGNIAPEPVWKRSVREHRYGTWAVFSLALSLLLGLMLVPAITAIRRSEGIYREIRANQAQFQTSRRVFEDLSQNLFTISLTVREFLVDSSPEAGLAYRSRLSSTREQLRSNIAGLREILPGDEREVLQKLEREVEGYVSLIFAVFEWTPRQRAERGAYFLRQEQRPRRQTILAVADELATVNTALYEQQQRRTTESETRFRRDLERSVLFALLAGIVVSASGILRMRWLERRAHEQHQRAEQTSEEMRQLSVRLRQAQEDERRTISRELHDDVGQKLTAMRMELGVLERRRGTSQEEFTASIDEVKELAEQSLRTIRDIAAGLRPSVLDELGLAAALQNQAREFSKRTGTPVSVSIEGEFAQLEDRHRTYIYRIVQEALTNCAKHARAHQITVSLIDRNNQIHLVVKDDGDGFDVSRTAHAGLGLIGIEERARELGGTTSVRSVPEQGTTVHVAIPHN
jgi:signal transduction histidine kinase